jgi:hypothetical protein
VLVSSLESASPATSSTMTATVTSPSTQPAAKAGPVARPRRAEHEDHRHDGDRAQGNPDGRGQQIADRVTEHGGSFVRWLTTSIVRR